LFLLGHDQPSATAPNPCSQRARGDLRVTWSFTVMGYRWLAARGASVAAAAVSGNLTAGTIALRDGQPLVAGRPVDWAVVPFSAFSSSDSVPVSRARGAPCSALRSASSFSSSRC